MTFYRVYEFKYDIARMSNCLANYFCCSLVMVEVAHTTGLLQRDSCETNSKVSSTTASTSLHQEAALRETMVHYALPYLSPSPEIAADRFWGTATTSSMCLVPPSLVYEKLYGR